MIHNFIKPFIFIALFLSVISLLPPYGMGKENQSLRIENVFTDKSVFNPTRGEKMELHFHLSKPAQVTVTLYDSLNRVVKKLLTNMTLQRGNHQLTWDGLGKDGKSLPQNYYLYTLEAETTDGQVVRYDPSDITGGESIGIQNIKYNRNTNHVFFTLKQNAIINLRVGMPEGGPMMNTLVDWMPLSEGQHTIKWDGRDRSGSVELKKVKKLNINGPAYALPMNAIILAGEKLLTRPVFLTDTDVTDDIRPESSNPKHRMMYNHWQHPRNKCYDPDILFRLPAEQKYNQDGVALVDGPLKLSLNINDSDRSFMLDQRFEIVLYVDFLFVHEEELGYLPYYWTWDPHGVNEGVHYVTAMLRGYEGHFGTNTIKVLVGKQNNEQ